MGEPLDANRSGPRVNRPVRVARAVHTPRQPRRAVPLRASPRRSSVRTAPGSPPLMTVPASPSSQPTDADMPQPDDIAMDDDPSPELLEHLKQQSHHEEPE